MYEKELEALDNINLKEIRNKTMINKSKKVTEQIKELSQKINDKIHESILKGENLICIDTINYHHESLYIIKKYLKKKDVYVKIPRRNVEDYSNFMIIRW